MRIFAVSSIPRCAGLCALLACAASIAFAQSKPIPQLTKSGDKFTFMVDGKPFIMLGGQVGNFSAFPDLMQRAWPTFKAMNLNTVEYPVYWNVIEPVEGKFDFTGFEQILQGLRAQGLRAMILWFGTWKNGAMDWSPNWVKADSKRTGIMSQVENEPGSLGSVRDFSPESNKLFNGPAPAQLVAALKNKPGTWKQAFGREADEAFNAYYISSYINEVAQAGKQVYPLPTLVNVWNGGYGTNDNWERFDRPGETYPSGGAVSHMLDLWKANAPAIDVIASDIYHQSPIAYLKILNSYRRPDNPLMVIETGRGIAGRAFFYAIADFAAIGFGPFGVDGGGPELRPDMAAVGADFRLLKSAIPVIAELQGTSRLKAAVEETGIGARNLIFGNYDALVRFRPPGRQPAGTIGPSAAAAGSGPPARVMIAELAPDEFLVMGFESSVEWRPVQGSDFTAAQFVSVAEGVFENGVWKRTVLGRTSQGDFAGPTVSLSAQGALMRVKLMRY